MKKALVLGTALILFGAGDLRLGAKQPRISLGFRQSAHYRRSNSRPRIRHQSLRTPRCRTLYGAASLVWFNVWSYQVDRAQVNLGDPVDLTKRLDGTTELRFAQRVGNG
jgi:hypothetical protein